MTKFLAYLLVLSLSSSMVAGCSMMSEQGRRERSHSRYVKKKFARVNKNKEAREQRRAKMYRGMSEVEARPSTETNTTVEGTDSPPQ